jgi:hypothetical protein
MMKEQGRILAGHSFSERKRIRLHGVDEFNTVFKKSNSRKQLSNNTEIFINTQEEHQQSPSTVNVSGEPCSFPTHEIIQSETISETFTIVLEQSILPLGPIDDINGDGYSDIMILGSILPHFANFTFISIMDPLPYQNPSITPILVIMKVSLSPRMLKASLFLIIILIRS